MTGEGSEESGGDGGFAKPQGGGETAREHDRRLIERMRELSRDMAATGQADAAEWLDKAAERLQHLSDNPSEEC